MSRRSDTQQIYEVENFPIPTSNTLCELCTNVFNVFDLAEPNQAPNPKVAPHHQNSLAVKTSADQGCHLCSLFYGALSLSPDEQTLPNVVHALGRNGPLEVELSNTRNSGESGFSLKLLDTSNRQGTVAEVSGTVGSPGFVCGSERDCRGHSSFANCTDSEASFRIASSWLARCRSEHKFCEESNHSDRIVPTRLIQIDAIDQTMHLKVVAAFDPCVEFLILSYCWGCPTSDEIMLKKCNVQSFSDSLSFPSLVKTVKDAILITHRLGFSYLWVDRLCIIQDDSEEWQQEALRMGGFYLNAVCCIAALSSPSSRGGCFVSRNSLIMQPMHIRRSPETVITIFPNVGGIQGDYPRLYRGPLYSLTRRAWTLPERLLSPRTLYYGSLMIYWECRQKHFSETRPCVDLKLPFSEELQKFSMDPTDTDNLWYRPRSKAAMDRFQSRFAGLVECYTSRQMTFAKDRLIAITGMLSSICTKVGGNFHYGLLLHNFARELLWWQWVDYTEPKRSPIDAPTWSWASVTGRISPFLARRYLGVDPLSWTVEATARELWPESHAGQYAALRRGRRCDHCVISFNISMLKALCIKRVDLRHYTWWMEAFAGRTPGRHLKLRARLWADDPVHEGKCIWLVRMAKHETGERPTPTFAGLAIEPVTSETDILCWRRVGYWQSVELLLNAAPSDAEQDFGGDIHLENLRSVVLI